MKSISLGTAHSRITRRSYSPSVGSASPLLETCTVSSTPLSVASLRHVHSTSPRAQSTSSTVRYTDELSDPVNRYWPTNTSSPGATKFTKSGLFTGRNAAVAGVVGSTVSVTRAPWRNTMGALGARASKLETSSGASKTPISGPRVSSMVAHSNAVSRIAARRSRASRCGTPSCPTRNRSAPRSCRPRAASPARERSGSSRPPYISPS